MSGADRRPDFEQVAAELRLRILQGRYPSDQQIPSMPELAREFSKAQATIQGAIAMLKDEGYLVSKMGKGVFVREKKPFVVTAAAYIPPEPKRFSYEILDVAEVVPPPIVADAFGMAHDGVAILRHRLMRYNGDPVEESWSYYPATLARGTALARTGKITGGAPRVLADAGFPQRRLVDRMSIRPPVTSEVELLEIPKGISVLQQFRVIYSDDPRPVEVSILVKGGHLYELEHSALIEEVP